MRHLLLSLVLALPAAGQQQAVFARVFDGITTPQASPTLRNIGQSMHLITVLFPAESAAVTGLQVRIEASFDNATWFPISQDITAAVLLGGVVYQIQKAYAPFPYLRVRSLAATGGKAMTVHYSGHLVPIVPLIEQTLDRFVL